MVNILLISFTFLVALLDLPLFVYLIFKTISKAKEKKINKTLVYLWLIWLLMTVYVFYFFYKANQYVLDI